MKDGLYLNKWVNPAETKFDLNYIPLQLNKDKLGDACCFPRPTPLSLVWNDWYSISDVFRNTSIWMSVQIGCERVNIDDY